MAGLSRKHGYFVDKPKSDYDTAYYQLNREHLKERARQYYHANRERSAERYLAKRDLISARNRARREADGPTVQAAARARYRKNPAPAIARANKRRAIKQTAAIGSDRVAYRAFVKSVRTAETIRCRWCQHFVPPSSRRIDHIIPLAKGGVDAVENLCCACRLCNAKKGDKLPHEFMPLRWLILS